MIVCLYGTFVKCIWSEEISSKHRAWKHGQKQISVLVLHQIFHHLTVKCCFIAWLIAYIALFSALLSRLTVLACGSTWVTNFIVHFFLNIHRSGVLTVLAWLVPHETAAILAQVLCTPYNHVTSCKATYVRCVCLAVTCHLHFWQNDWDLLCATAVTWGWNGYRNKSAQKVDPREENSPTAPAGIRTRDLSITSPVL